MEAAPQQFSISRENKLSNRVYRQLNYRLRRPLEEMKALVVKDGTNERDFLQIVACCLSHPLGNENYDKENAQLHEHLNRGPPEDLAAVLF